MDRNEFEQLKNLDTREITWNIFSELRGDFAVENALHVVVSLTALASILKETGNKIEMLSFIKDRVKDDTTLSFLNKLISGSFSQIQELSAKYENNVLKAVALFSEPSRFTESDINATPEGIANLSISLLNIADNDVVLDMGSGVNSFLIQAGLVSVSKSLMGVEINTQCVIIANIRTLITGLPISVIQGNIISQDFSEFKATKVFSNPPFGVRWSSLQSYISNNKKLSKYFKDAKRTVSSDWAYAISAHLNQVDEGKTIVLMTNAGTWNNPDEEIRKRLIEEGLIEGVILLPARLFSSTSIALTMMIFSQNNKEIKMVDASDLYSKGRRINTLESNDIAKILAAYHQDSEISRVIPIKEISEQEYILNPQRYVRKDSDIDEGIALRDICLSINRGSMITSTELDELASSDDTGYQYLMLQNIQDGVVDTNLPTLSKIDEKYKKYCIHDKNLILSKISPFKVAMAHVPEGKTILANGNLYFIELDESKVNLIFVEFFLQSEAGMAQLNRYAKGTAMKSISIQDLMKIKIPALPLNEQNRIAEKYETLCEELIVLQKQTELIKDKKARLIEEVI